MPDSDFSPPYSCTDEFIVVFCVSRRMWDISFTSRQLSSESFPKHYAQLLYHSCLFSLRSRETLLNNPRYNRYDTQPRENMQHCLFDCSDWSGPLHLKVFRDLLNPLKPELNPIFYLLALLGAHHFLHVSRIRVKSLTHRLLMSYIYGAPTLDVSRSHTTTQHSR